MVGQHYSARSDTNRFGCSRYMSDKYCGGRTCDANRIVVFGKPESAVPERFRLSRKINTAVQRFGDIAAFGNYCKFKYGIGYSAVVSFHFVSIWSCYKFTDNVRSKG